MRLLAGDIIMSGLGPPTEIIVIIVGHRTPADRPWIVLGLALLEDTPLVDLLPPRDDSVVVSHCFQARFLFNDQWSIERDIKDHALCSHNLVQSQSQSRHILPQFLSIHNRYTDLALTRIQMEVLAPYVSLTNSYALILQT
jgi:hypothetical protein